MVSKVVLATPPKNPELGEGRINAFSSFESSSILVLSPKIEPLFNEELGSMAKTATFFPFLIANRPKFSIKVDFPAPGTPVIPTLTLFPVSGRISFKIISACSRCSRFLLSTKVMAFPRMRLSPDFMPVINSSVENFINSKIRFFYEIISIPNPGFSDKISFPESTKLPFAKSFEIKLAPSKSVKSHKDATAIPAEIPTEDSVIQPIMT